MHQEVGTVKDAGAVAGTIQAGEGSRVHPGGTEHHGDVAHEDEFAGDKVLGD